MAQLAAPFPPSTIQEQFTPIRLGLKIQMQIRLSSLVSLTALYTSIILSSIPFFTEQKGFDLSLYYKKRTSKYLKVKHKKKIK